MSGGATRSSCGPYEHRVPDAWTTRASDTTGGVGSGHCGRGGVGALWKGWGRGTEKPGVKVIQRRVHDGILCPEHSLRQNDVVVCWGSGGTGLCGLQIESVCVVEVGVRSPKTLGSTVSE